MSPPSNPPLIVHDRIPSSAEGRRPIEHVDDDPYGQLERDILRMFDLARRRAATSAGPWRCYLHESNVLVCEIFPDAVLGQGSWFETPTFFPNDLGVTFLARGLPLNVATRLYGVRFLPGQFRTFCHRLLRENGWMDRN